MSDKIPFEMQSDIMKRLPVKSLLRFRSVSKSCKSLISSSRFISEYRYQVPHLLVRYAPSVQQDPDFFEHTYVSVVDDHTFPHQKVSVTLPESIKMLTYHRIIGISHGLVCLYNRSTRVAVIWNISVRKLAPVVVPALANEVYETALGFGVCRETSDPKIVKIRYVDPFRPIEMMGIIPNYIPSQVEVFTLSTGAWRSPHGNLPRTSIFFYTHDEVVVDGVCYWLGKYRVDDGNRLIVSFDMTSEEFREITVPDAVQACYCISMSSLGDALVVYGYNARWGIDSDFWVWMMEDGGSNSFTKLFMITPIGDALVRGFRKSTGEPIVAIEEGGGCGRLAVYEPYSKHIDHLGIDGRVSSSLVHPYVETLFLLDHPYNMLYNDI